jgi:hypothetical protein
MGFVAAGWMNGRPPRAWYSADSRTTAAVFTFCPRVDVRVPSYTPDAHPPAPEPAGATVSTARCVYSPGRSACQANAALALTHRGSVSRARGFSGTFTAKGWPLPTTE